MVKVMSKLAIDGGSKVFETPANIPSWPPVYEDTADEIREIYLSHAWSFYGKKEASSTVYDITSRLFLAGNLR